MAKTGKSSAAKATRPTMPSKAQMAKEDQHYRAESMVRDSMQNTPQFKRAVRTAEQQLAKVEKTVKATLKSKAK